MGILFVPEGVGLARATVRSQGYADFSFFLRIGEPIEPLALSISAPTDPAAGLVGISVSANGEPVEGAEVYVDGILRGSTRADGTIGVALEKGTHTIRAEYEGQTAEASVTAWEERATSIQLDSARIEQGERLSGSLLDEFGNPVRGARIVVGGRSGVTGSDGRFEVDTSDIEPGSHLVISEHRFDPDAYVSYSSSSIGVEVIEARAPLGWALMGVLVLAVLALALKRLKIRWFGVKYPR